VAAEGDGAEEGNAADAPVRKGRLRKAVAAEDESFTHREEGEEEVAAEDEAVAEDGDDDDYTGDAAKKKKGDRKEKKKRRKKDVAEDGAEKPAKKRKGKADAADGGKRRPKRAAAAAAEASNFGGFGDAEGGVEGGAEGGESGGEEDAEEGRAVYAADNDDDGHPGEQAVEAGSKSDFDTMLDRLKKRKKVERAQDELVADAVAFLSKMDDCAKEDFDAHRDGIPAVRKVAFMAQMEAEFRKEFMHDILIDRGALRSLAQWLAPLSDGTLPNPSVRSAVLRALAMFDCDEDFKERLRASGVGKFVMLLSKHSTETLASKKKCLDLIEKWMRPVYKKSIEYTTAARFARPREEGRSSRPYKPALAAEGDGDDLLAGVARAPQPGEAGFRMRASIPLALTMDFRLMPQSSAVPKASKKFNKESAKGKLTSKFMAIKRGKGGKCTQGEQISIQGSKL